MAPCEWLEGLDAGQRELLGVLEVGGDELHPAVSEAVDAPAHGSGDGLGVLAPAVAVGLGALDHAPARNSLPGRRFELGPVPFGDEHRVELLVLGHDSSGIGRSGLITMTIAPSRA